MAEKEMPFRFRWCYEPEDEDEDELCNVLLLGTTEAVTPLHIDITNNLTDKTISINPLDGITEANSTNYHFKLAFNPGILVSPENISLGSENWSISSFRDAMADNVYLLWTGDENITLSSNEAIEVILTGVAAQTLVTRTATTNVTISWKLEKEGVEIIEITKSFMAGKRN